MRRDFFSGRNRSEDFEGDISAVSKQLTVILAVVLEEKVVSFQAMNTGMDQRGALTLTKRAGPRKR